jgi:solute carrier family 66, member 2
MSIAFLVAAAMAVLPATVYIDQFGKLAKDRAARRESLQNAAWRAFDHRTCGLLLVSNIVRLFYCVAMIVPFALELRVQSVLLIITQFLLLRQYLLARSRGSRHRTGSVSDSSNTSTVSSIDSETGSAVPNNVPMLFTSSSSAISSVGSNYRLMSWVSSFWKWESYTPYVTTCMILVVMLAAAQLAGIPQLWPGYESILGYTALGIEATVPVPQAYNNWLRKSTSGMSFFMLLGWFGGDAFKTSYFVRTGAALPFLVCAVIQLSIDVFIGLQMAYYSFRNAGAGQGYTEIASSTERARSD